MLTFEQVVSETNRERRRPAGEFGAWTGETRTRDAGTPANERANNNRIAVSKTTTSSGKSETL
jgi:hypothetical protein